MNVTPRKSPKVAVKPLTVRQLSAYRRALIANAASLVDDAQCLADAHRHSRAFALAVLAVEELAKAHRTVALHVDLKSGVTPDWSILDSRNQRNHSAKLRLALDLFQAVRTPTSGESRKQLKELLLSQPELEEAAKDLHSAKLTALYVDWDAADSTVVSPRIVSAALAAKLIKFARRHLRDAESLSGALGKVRRVRGG